MGYNRCAKPRFMITNLQRGIGSVKIECREIG